MSRKTKQKITDENVHSGVSKKSPDNQQKTSSDLRIRAEKYLENRLFKPDSMSGLDRGEIQSLLHELQIHQIELEVQNEELRLAQIKLEELKDKYLDLYDLAPVGYVTINEHGVIIEANLTFAHLLGIARNRLVGKHFSQFVAPSDRPTYLSHRQGLVERRAEQTCELGLIRNDGSLFNARLQSIPLLGEHGSIGCRTVVSNIAEFKKADEALRESEELHRAIFNNAGIGIDMVDKQGRFEHVNPALADMLEYTQEELQNLTIDQVSHPEDIEPSKSKLEDFFRGKIDSYRLEKRYVSKNGNIIWADVSVSAMRDVGGRNIRDIGVISDITSRKNAERALRDSEEKYRLLVENANEAIFIAQGDFIKFANPRTVEILGYSADELASTPLAELIHPDDREILLERYGKRLRGQPVEQVDPFRIITKSGITKWVELNAVRIQWDGRPATLNLGNDITERKRMREAQSRLTTAVEQAAEGIVITDAQGTVQYVNPAYAEITGYAVEEVLGRNPSILKSGKHPKSFYKEMWNTITGGRTWSGHLINKKKNGSLFEEEATISPVRDAFGDIINYVAVKRDVTHEQALQRELLQAQKMEAVGTLAGGVAHDFNNLLQVVLGYSELLLIEPDTPNQMRGDLEKINLAARNGAELVQRLLTFSRRTQIEPRPLNLNHRITEVQQILVRTIPKIIEVALILDDRLAPIDADPTQIDQILMNLTLNAKDAMPEGGKLLIETENATLDNEYCMNHFDAKPGDYVLLKVSDTGHGMDKETREHVFEPFFTTKPIGEGTGLGMAMVYGSVKQHGGCVMCYSEPDQGTTFILYFPALKRGIESEPVVSEIMPAGGNETVLLVDDEEFVCELGKRILSKAGYTVLTAANGREALELYSKSQDIALIILDLIMPEMAGKECMEEILRIDPQAKILIASGYSANSSTQKIIDKGARGFVGKPYNVRKMLQTIRDVLDAE
ncbi:MAG: PAS domain S-box protein [Desulfomonilaceae bacterium]